MPVKKIINKEVQELFFAKLKQVMPANVSMAEELAELLNVSTDSAYRRIRGETEVTISEIFEITKKYALSVDNILGTSGNNVSFTYTKLVDSANNFEIYLSRILGHLKFLSQSGNGKLVYVACEIPMFYSFFSKKLTAFKLFYWQRSVMNIPEYQEAKFEWDILPKNITELAQSVYNEYMTIPSSEIWTVETVFTGLRQISFYFESGILTKEQALELLTEYRNMIEMVQKNAGNSRKNVSDKNETFWFYCSEVVVGTNCIYVTAGEARASYISFNSINSLTTTNNDFCDETENWLRNIEKKSTLISGVAEKQRYQFFSQMFAHIDKCVERISAAE
ncbi:MAG: hypothetical protein KF900_03030 [Bacteroidetes bacterium]|nr:hypothetical protein [Bacteroidota bacterium]